MAELVAEVLDVARERLVDAQPVVGEQRDQRRRPRPVGPGGVEEGLELVAGEADAHRRVGNAGAFDVGDGVVLEHVDLDGVAVEARQAREPPGDARRRLDLASALRRVGQLARPQRDVVAARGERVQLAVGAPRVPGPQIVEVGATCLLAPALDRNAATSRQNGSSSSSGMPSSPRGSRSTAAAGSSGGAGSAGGTATGPTTSTSLASLTEPTVDGGCDGS